MSLRVILLLLFEVSFYAAVSSKKVCGRPTVSGEVEVEALQRVYEPGEEAVLSCAPGYTRAGGSRVLICTRDGDWGKVSLKCAPKSCPPPDNPTHGTAEFIDIVYKSTINYTCDEGYNLNGTTNSTCMHDGKWSHPPPVCEPVTCGLAPIPISGKIVYDKKPVGDIVTFGFGGRYECLPPLALFGNERASCSAHGNWTAPPECRPVECPVPARISHGFITFAVRREHGYKERVKYGCDVNYVMDGAPEIECEKTGQWSTKPVCRAPCTVGIKRGRIFYNAKKMWIEDFKPNRLLHNEYVAVYCLNKEKKCGYPIATQCVDGTLKIPECYEEPSGTTYNIHSKSLPSEINMCP
ncbi:beta-2-glycoprotein 1-like [Sardina pilchardus]|uniref:beta-2-glycoprotein 1-like n=1 Tax=Sardina pilchardus TaxID=27697 RepID=UPI002E0D2CC9